MGTYYQTFLWLFPNFFIFFLDWWLEYIDYIYEVFVNFIHFETNTTFNGEANKSKNLKSNQNASNFKMKFI
jgi:hypothetical protein